MVLRKVFPEETRWAEIKTKWRRHLLVEMTALPSSHAGQPAKGQKFVAALVHTASGSHITADVDHTKHSKKHLWEQFKLEA